MTNGEMIQSMFPNMNFGTLAQDDVIVNRDYSKNDEPQVFIPQRVWDSEYKEPIKEQEPVLDKIKSEIENDWQLKKFPSSPFSCGLKRAIEIIDKYKAESEPQEISDRNLKMWEEIFAEEKRRESEE